MKQITKDSTLELGDYEIVTDDDMTLTLPPTDLKQGKTFSLSVTNHGKGVITIVGPEKETITL